MKNQLLKVIAEIPSNAAYWMGQRNGYEQEIKEVLTIVPVASVKANDSVIRDLYWWLDQCNDNFAKEMGWK